jgi:hypothetical protein
MEVNDRKRDCRSPVARSYHPEVSADRGADFRRRGANLAVALYKKVGFEIVAEEMILGVSNRFMWRAAQAICRDPEVN